LQTYDIPAQSLAVALDHYASVSGRAAVFASALAAGRRSAPVHGNYDSKSALRLLLTDTGLSASEVVSGNVVTFVLKGAVLPVRLRPVRRRRSASAWRRLTVPRKPPSGRPLQ